MVKKGTSRKKRLVKKKDRLLIDGNKTQLIEDSYSKCNEQIEELKKENAELKESVLSLKDQLLRKAADYENARKIMLKERDSHINGYVDKILSEIITVLDDFDRAIIHYDKTSNTEETMKGIIMIDSNFHKLLERFNVMRFSSIGEKFDPSFHEAISVGNDISKQDGIILEELAKGYKINDKILRPAKVIVNQNIEEEND